MLACEDAAGQLNAQGETKYNALPSQGNIDVVAVPNDVHGVPTRMLLTHGRFSHVLVHILRLKELLYLPHPRDAPALSSHIAVVYTPSKGVIPQNTNIDVPIIEKCSTHAEKRVVTPPFVGNHSLGSTKPFAVIENGIKQKEGVILTGVSPHATRLTLGKEDLLAGVDSNQTNPTWAFWFNQTPPPPLLLPLQLVLLLSTSLLLIMEKTNSFTNSKCRRRLLLKVRRIGIVLWWGMS